MDSSGPSQAAESLPDSQPEEMSPSPKPVATFPPYPPYAMPPAPPSVADTIIAGRDLRLKHKSVRRKPVHPQPRPAKPRGPKATDVKLSKRALRAHARCLRTHGTAITDRLERISKPQRRKIIYLWREYAQKLPPETVARLRAMLDVDEPFKPDEAYEYFFNLKKGKKKHAVNARVTKIKKDIISMYGDKRFLWARNATVAFARGIQQRLAKSGNYALRDRMLRLSNIILDEICGYMHMKTPSRQNNNPKAKFMMDISDKVAVWIDEILSESDDRMLMMDFDEDEDVKQYMNEEKILSNKKSEEPAKKAPEEGPSNTEEQTMSTGPSSPVSAPSNDRIRPVTPESTNPAPKSTPTEGVTPAMSRTPTDSAPPITAPTTTTPPLNRSLPTSPKPSPTKQ